MPIKILLIEDEPKIVEICQDYLVAAGFDVVVAADGVSGLNAVREENPDLVVLDIMLPKLNGLDVCRKLRRQGSIPIIILTARVDEIDKLIGLELGADDYMTKPFSPRELIARIRTVLRRTGGNPTAETIRAGELVLNRARYIVSLPGKELTLTPTEFELLATLASQPGRIFTRTQLLHSARGVSFECYERAIDSHIRNLRQKIEIDVKKPHYIHTVYGVGYKFTE